MLRINSPVMRNERPRDPRQKLKEARLSLGLSLRKAAALIGVSYQQVANYEYGGGSRHGDALSNISNLCRAYMKLAKAKGYTPADFHESALCPGEFPRPRAAAKKGAA